MKTLIYTIILIFLFAVGTMAQNAICPVQYVCLSQEAANKAAENVRELEATKNKVKVLEDALKEKDKTISELQLTGGQNLIDLKEALRKMEVELSYKSGQLVSVEAERVRLLAIIEALLKVAKPKKFGLINF